MKAVFITKAGGPEVLQIKNTEKPIPKDNEVLIKVNAAGINRSDILIRENPKAYGKDLPAAKIPGLEVAGTIVQLGENVSNFNINNRVCALVAGGGYAEYICVDERLCLPIPENLNFTEAAALPEALYTIWFNLFQQANLQPNEKLLIHGGTSGIGVLGLQMAKAIGCKVYTTAGSKQKINFLNDIGVKNCINYKEQNFEAILANTKLDVILDMVGGDYTNKNLKLLQPKGRLVNINAMKSLNANINLWEIISKNLTLTGSLLKPQPIEVKAKITEELKKHIFPFLESEEIKPFVYQTFTMDCAGEAHELMQSSKHIGKIVLKI